ncbi:outer membrane lipoprotein-sorting protein [Massilia sp. GER05]|uniref:outer membrane lipoprotein-sorting protein n=1 Tax=Massilia sp. GER05 TaxID=3394605 RepID=UPI003F868561
MLCYFAWMPAVAGALSAQDMLAISDAVRNPGKPFRVDTELVEYRHGRKIDTTKLAVYSRVSESTGQFRSLVRFLAPERDVNKLMLKMGNELWYYDAANKSSIRIPPQQRLLGQAANGDVVTVNFARDYVAEIINQEDIRDGDRVARPCNHLKLTAKTEDVLYPLIDMWVDSTSNRPVKAQFKSDSGRLLKTVYYRRYRSELGGERPTETVIIDGVDATWITVMQYTNYAFRDIPESWYQRDYLPRFNPE